MRIFNIEVDRAAFGAGAALTFFIVTQTMLTAATKTDDGLPYKTTSAILLQEIIKLSFASAFWFNFDYTKINNGLPNLTVKNFLMYSVPGLTYAFQNSIVYSAIAILGPPTFQVFSNFKIVTTAILHRMILKRSLTIIQWLAVVLLFTAMVISKLTVFSNSGQSGAWAGREELIFGAGLLVVNSTLSAFSGVFNEWLIKKIDPDAPLQFKNMQLYFFGVVLNFLGNMFQGGQGTSDDGFFTGFTPLVWIIIINNAALGISVAFIMKYANNVVKCFTGAIAVYIASCLSSIFFNETIDVAFMCGVVVLTVALYLYMGNHNNLIKAQWEQQVRAPPAIDMDRMERARSH
ncbi:hypothetical protein AAMO2058_000346600 [Amorphochlora amoebiformis]